MSARPLDSKRSMTLMSLNSFLNVYTDDIPTSKIEIITLRYLSNCGIILQNNYKYFDYVSYLWQFFVLKNICVHKPMWRVIF